MFGTCIIMSMSMVIWGCDGARSLSLLDTDTLSLEEEELSIDSIATPLGAGSNGTISTTVEVVEPTRLQIYYPNSSRIELICGKMPEKTDSTVIFMASAAYTVKCKEKFSHDNIIGNHVSEGHQYRGTSSDTYRGAFVYYNATPKFVYNDWAKEFELAVENRGCGFAQDMMIHEGKEVDHWRESSSENRFRALCMINGKVAIADSDGKISFGNFIQELLKVGATEAIYLDMGGWDYSWYRDDNGKVIEINPKPNKYATNWITFYK